MNIGLVFEGGGGKGAYQIGVWRALRELGIEPFVTCVSGTSVGALNAALFYMSSLEVAEDLWSDISDEDILQDKTFDAFEQTEGIFSREKMEALIEYVVHSKRKNRSCKKCFVTCRYRDKNEYRYFEWSKFRDPELKKKILSASSAMPIVFDSVEIDGDRYIDGGANGDNTPVVPLVREEPDCIVIIHLSDKATTIPPYNGEVVEIFPEKSLGGFIDGTLDFSPTSVRERMEAGYRDGKKALIGLADRCCIEKVSKNIKGRKTVKKSTEKQKIKKNGKGKIEREDIQMANFKFTSEEARKLYEDKLATLKKIADSDQVDEAYLWDETAKKYASKMTKVRTILKSEGIHDLIATKMFKDIDNFLKRCSDAEFHIALVGAIKAGKSTLINALLGHEYASTKVTPETAALTKFKKGSTNYVKISFYSNEEWDNLWKSAEEAKATVFLEEYQNLQGDAEKNSWLGKSEKQVECETKEELVSEIQKWTSSKSVCHYFVKEVEVGLQDFELPEGVVLVDTPGLDDVVEYRSNITRDYIDRANAVLVCVKSDALTGQEMATIYSVFANTRNNPEKVYIIATQVDTLNRPVENWRLQREEWLKYLKGRGAYNSLDLAEKNLVPVSAYFYTLLKEYNNLEEDEDRRWDLESIIRKFRIVDINEKYQEMIDFTNIALLKNKIRREIVENYKKLLIEDIVDSYENCKDSIKEAMEKIKLSQEEILRTTQGGIEEIKKKQEECDLKVQEAEADRKNLAQLLKTLKMQTTKRADELESAIRNLLAK